MKYYTQSQIYRAFEKSLANDWRANDLLDALKAAPFYKTTVKLIVTFTLCKHNGETWFEIPIHIMVHDADVKRAIITEISTQIHKFGELSYYEDKTPELNFKNINVACHAAYSFKISEYAIFHEEQECGFSWLSIDTTDLTAPFTYEQGQKAHILRRSETNAIKTHFVNNRR